MHDSVFEAKTRRPSRRGFGTAWIAMVAVIVTFAIGVILIYYSFDDSNMGVKDHRAGTYRVVGLRARDLEEAPVTNPSMNFSIWRVAIHKGLAIRHNPFESEGAIIYVLPQDSILVASNLIAADSPSSSREGTCIFPNGFYAQLKFPLEGWLYSGTCLQEGKYENVLEVLKSRRIRLPRISLSDTQRSCTIDSVLYDTDLRGGDLEMVSMPGSTLHGGPDGQGQPHDQDPMECCKICLRNPLCKAWTSVSGTECWLKSDGYSLITSKDKANRMGHSAASDRKILVSGTFEKLARNSPSSSPPRDSHPSKTSAEARPQCCSTQASNSEEPVDEFFSDSNGFLRSSKVMKLQQSGIEWHDQFPIGTGRLGALVGGSYDSEIIPLSAPGFYITRETRVPSSDIPEPQSWDSIRGDFLSGRDPKSLMKSVGDLISSMGYRTSSGTPSRPQSDHTESDWVHRSPLGRFEYLCDVTVLFDLPLKSMFDHGGAAGTHENIRHGEDLGKTSEQSHSVRRELSGRRGLLQHIRSRLYDRGFESSIKGVITKWIATSAINDKSGAFAQTAEDEEDADINVFEDISEGFLNTSSGIVNSFHLSVFEAPVDDLILPARNLVAVSALYVQVQHREWFASLTMDAIFGRFMGVYASMRSQLARHDFQSEQEQFYGSGELISGIQDVTVSLSRDRTSSPSDDSIPLKFQHSSYKWGDPLEISSYIGNISPRDIIRAALLAETNVTNYENRSRVYGLEGILSGGAADPVTVHSPEAVVCVVVICLRQSNSDETNSETYSSVDDDPAIYVDLFDGDAIVCRSVDEAQVFIASEVGGMSFGKGNTFFSPSATEIPELKKRCWAKLHKALKFGYHEAKRQHARHFEVKASELSEVVFSRLKKPSATSAVASTCSDVPINNRVPFFTDGCSEKNDNTISSSVASSDVMLASQLYAFDLYLMFISSAEAVSNLQGIWADGPSSAWSGDYHTNINLQMNYWAAHSTGLAATTTMLDPLISFIEHVAFDEGSGRDAASRMYGCEGWIMHGFTDQTLRAFPMAEPVWSLCVSCGAWLSMHLWDAISYESIKSTPFDRIIRSIQGKASFNIDEALLATSRVPENTILKRAIPIYRGIASFFLDYMWKGNDGRFHTGPTTSPENSYALIKEFFQNGTYKPRVSVEYFAASPAIDISVLREISNAYLIATKWRYEEVQKRILVFSALRSLVVNNDNADFWTSDIEASHSNLQVEFKILKKDIEKAKTFLDRVRSMPGAGAPVMSLREESHDQNFVSPFYKSDQSQTAKAFFISEYPGLLFGGKLDATNIDITETKWAVATTSTSRLNLSNLFSSLMEKRDSKAAVSVHNPSHRHWSGMHWLYPSSFIPFGSLMHSEVTIKSSIDIKTANLLYDAAEATLREKSRAGGGHTGWSAVWGACLWARAARGEEAWVYMSRIFQKYSAPNLLGLHPSLTHFSPHNCDTCYIDPTLDRPRITSEFSNQAPQDRPTSSFHSDYSTYKERRRHGSLALEPLSRPLRSQMWGALGFGKGKRMRNFDARYESVRNDRGLETSDNAKFQYDTNAGYLAAVSEMLLQCHVSPLFSILPALPTALSDAGYANKLRCRGSTVFSMRWNQGRVQHLKIRLEERHPWLSVGLTEDAEYPGFYDTDVNVAEEIRDSAAALDKHSAPSSKPVALVLDVPNRMKLTESSGPPTDEGSLGTPCALLKERKRRPGLFRRQKALNAALYDVYISEFPCQLEMISIE